MLQEKLDTIAVIKTPEAIDVVLRPAGVLPRSMAFLLDFAIRLIWFLVTTPLLLFLGSFGIGLIVLNAFFSMWLYHVVCEVKFNGVSLGKKAMGLRVVNDDGTPIQFSASLLRNLLRTADVLPMMYTFGILSSIFHPQSKRLGDLVAGTMVVYADKRATRPDIALAVSIPSPVVLNREEQRAILAFAERNKKLSYERQQELAMIVAPTLGVTPVEAIPMLLGIAQNLAGQMKTEEARHR